MGNATFPREKVTSQVFAVMAGSADEADALSTACVGCVDNAKIAAVHGSKVTGKVAAAATADMVTNGVYTTGSYTNPAWITSLDGSKITGTVASATSAVNFTGPLAGDVTGSQTAALVVGLRGKPISTVAAT